MNTLTKLTNALRILHEAVGEPATARHLQVLVAVAEGPRCTSHQLESDLGLSAAAVHRAVGRLGDGYLDGRKVRQPGAGLVEREWHGGSGGYKAVRLTAPGKTVAEKIEAALADVEYVPPRPVVTPPEPPYMPNRPPRRQRTINPVGDMVDDFDYLTALGFEVTRPDHRKRSTNGGHMPGTRAVRHLGDAQTPDAIVVEIWQGPRRGVRWRVRARKSPGAPHMRLFHLLGFGGHPEDGESYTATEAAAATQKIADRCHQRFLGFNRNR